MNQKKYAKKIATILLCSTILLPCISSYGLIVYADEIPIILESSELQSTQLVQPSENQTVQNTIVAIITDSTIHSIPLDSISSSTDTSSNIQVDTTSTLTLTTEVASTTIEVPTIINSDVSITTSTPLSSFFITTGTTTSATSTELSTTTELDVSTLPTGTTTIQTGDSVATANILNIVNTNLINSTGSIILANYGNGYGGTIDLRDSTTSTSTGVCTLLSCGGIATVDAHIQAVTKIDNSISVVATSGSNTIDTAQVGQIFSGDTSASLNLINIANTNLIDSHYFLLTLNSFNTINGDIVLPSLSSLFSNSKNILTNASTLAFNQLATITNNLDVTASGGDNHSEATASTIQSGGSLSQANIFNSINSLLIGGVSASLLLTISGTWDGELVNAPLGSSLVHEGNTWRLNFESATTSAFGPYTTSDITASSAGEIINNVTVSANSGNNETVNTDVSHITTGTSLASANIINIANATIIGRNWVLAIINIFGDFNGDVAFGRPDMWLGEQVSAASSIIENGTILTYTITVTNKGDSRASQVKVISGYDSNHLNGIDSDTSYTETTPGVLVFLLGTMEPNETKNILFRSTIHDTVPGTNIVSSPTVTEHEVDNNIVDNTDSTTITTTLPQSVGGSSGGNNNVPIVTVIPIASIPTVPPINTFTSLSTLNDSQAPSSLVVKRQTSTSTIIGEGTLGEQVLTISNLSSSPISSVSFDDVLYDSHGTKVRTEAFEIGNLLPNEEVTISYAISFGSNAQLGTFKLSSEVRYSSNQKMVYNSNGYIIYTSSPHAVVGAIKATSLSQEIQIPLQTVTAIADKHLSQASVLDTFLQSLLPQKVYAGEIAIAEDSSISLPMKSLAIATLSILIFLMIVRSYYVYRSSSKTKITNL